jgi:hypothetical protein
MGDVELYSLAMYDSYCVCIDQLPLVTYGKLRSPSGCGRPTTQGPLSLAKSRICGCEAEGYCSPHQARVQRV